MSRNATFRPLRPETWRGERTPASQRYSRYRFRANWQTTFDDLLTELRQLKAKDIVIEAGFRDSDIRLDGWPRANAPQPKDPGIRIAFESKHGPMVYQCDRYDGWQENVRAIALGLKALRAVDRYGITGNAEQYTGFRAIEAPRTFTGFATVDDALSFLRQKSELSSANDVALKTLVRIVARKCHPDHGGTNDAWTRFDEATRLLRKEGLL